MILIWDLEGGHEPSMTLIGKTDPVKIKPTKSYYLIITILGHEDAITCLSILPNFDIISGSVDKYVFPPQNFTC